MFSGNCSCVCHLHYSWSLADNVLITLLQVHEIWASNLGAKAIGNTVFGVASDGLMDSKTGKFEELLFDVLDIQMMSGRLTNLLSNDTRPSGMSASDSSCSLASSIVWSRIIRLSTMGSSIQDIRLNWRHESYGSSRTCPLPQYGFPGPNSRYIVTKELHLRILHSVTHRPACLALYAPMDKGAHGVSICDGRAFPAKELPRSRTCRNDLHEELSLLQISPS